MKSMKSKSKATKPVKTTIKTPAMNMSEKLPLDVLVKILSNLNLETLLKLRFVNKRWKEAVSKVKINEITFQDLKFYIQMNHLLDCMWTHTNKPFRNLIKYGEDDPKFRILRSKSFDFSCLKRLKVDYPITFDVDISFLNHFKQLEQLELSTKGVNSDNKTLKLPNLKILYIARIDNGYLYLEVPNLEAFYSKNGFELIKFKEPAKKPKQCIGTIELTTTNQASMIGSLHVSHIKRYEILEHLPKLNFVRLFYMDCMPFYPHIKTIHESIKHLLRQKVKFNRPNLQVYYGRKLITSAAQLKDESLDGFGKEHVFSFSGEQFMRAFK